MKTISISIAVTALTMMSAATANAVCSVPNHEFSDGAIVVSDEAVWPCAGYSNLCNPGRLVTGTTCTGSYCDNMRYQCAPPPTVMGAATSLSGYPTIANQFDPVVHYGWHSEEDGVGDGAAKCPMGYAMVGGYASNSYSDNIRTVCQMINRAGGWGGVVLTEQMSGSFSEEYPNTSFSSPTTWLTGQTCSGSFCDNMYMWFVTVN